MFPYHTIFFLLGFYLLCLQVLGFTTRNYLRLNLANLTPVGPGYTPETHPRSQSFKLVTRPKHFRLRHIPSEKVSGFFSDFSRKSTLTRFETKSIRKMSCFSSCFDFIPQIRGNQPGTSRQRSSPLGFLSSRTFALPCLDGNFPLVPAMLHNQISKHHLMSYMGVTPKIPRNDHFL